MSGYPVSVFIIKAALYYKNNSENLMQVIFKKSKLFYKWTW